MSKFSLQLEDSLNNLSGDKKQWLITKYSCLNEIVRFTTNDFHNTSPVKNQKANSKYSKNVITGGSLWRQRAAFPYKWKRLAVFVIIKPAIRMMYVQMYLSLLLFALWGFTSTQVRHCDFFKSRLCLLIYLKCFIWK